MKKLKIDINADVGEGMGNELELFPLISSCSIACGGHIGDQQSMNAIVELAKKFKLKIGAHPSFDDKKNFGRKILKIKKDKLIDSLESQIKSLIQILNKNKIKLNHIKPHGALYNLAANDKKTALIIIGLANKYNTKLYVPYGSLISKLALNEGIRICNELFIDRNYNDDFTLVSRNNKNALIQDSKKIFNHVNHIINNKTILTINKKNISVAFDTLCIHGDNPKAVQLMKNLFLTFEENGLKIN